jgi:hypothetical protein
MASKTYTSDELGNLTNPELDAVVARVVMGWSLVQAGRYVYAGAWKGTGWSEDQWRPSTEWESCGLVIERMLKRGFLMTTGTNYVSFELFNGYRVWVKKSLCRAICEAAMLATQDWRAGRRKGTNERNGV